MNSTRDSLVVLNEVGAWNAVASRVLLTPQLGVFLSEWRTGNHRDGTRYVHTQGFNVGDTS
jgi:hypothetical protein